MSDLEDNNHENKNVDLVEKLKRDRTSLRRMFTTACNQFVELQKEDIQGKKLQICYNKILDKSKRLFQIEEELSNYIEISDEEYNVIESYRDKFIEVQTEYECNVKILSCKEIDSTLSTDNLILPKLDLKEYDLVPRNWVAFWGQFSRVHDDKRLKEEDKFQYLLSSLKPKTRAREIADSYPPSKDNYPKIIEHLKSRFGRNDLLIEVYIRDLLALVINRSNVKLSVLYDQLGTYLRALETLGVTTENYAAMLYPVVESCLPVDTLKAWDRHRLNRESFSDSSRYLAKEKLLEELMSFLRNEVEGEEHRILAESGFNSQKNKKYNTEPSGPEVPSASALISSSNRYVPKLRCIFCDKSHNSQDCGKTAQMSLEEKKSEVIKKRCCLVCLKIGHQAKYCRSSVRCIICSRRHYALMCPELEKKRNFRR